MPRAPPPSKFPLGARPVRHTVGGSARMTSSSAAGRGGPTLRVSAASPAELPGVRLSQFVRVAHLAGLRLLRDAEVVLVFDALAAGAGPFTRSAGCFQTRCPGGMRGFVTAGPRDLTPSPPPQVEDGPGVADVCRQAGYKRGGAPQHISRALHRAHPDDRTRRVATETIHQAIYLPGTGIPQKSERCRHRCAPDVTTAWIHRFRLIAQRLV